MGTLHSEMLFFREVPQALFPSPRRRLRNSLRSALVLSRRGGNGSMASPPMIFDSAGDDAQTFSEELQNRYVKAGFFPYQRSWFRKPGKIPSKPRSG
jgi:hypothetical protein